jgi:hypothetical protein
VAQQERLILGGELGKPLDAQPALLPKFGPQHRKVSGEVAPFRAGCRHENVGHGVSLAGWSARITGMCRYAMAKQRTHDRI